jgi:hypothetical protein
MPKKHHKNSPKRQNPKTRRSRSASAPSQRRRRPRSYTPLSDALSQPRTFADTELSEGIRRHGLGGLLQQAIHRQRRRDGEPLLQVLGALLVWPLLKAKSLHCFCSELCQFLSGQVSILYDFLGREDINWRALSSQLARQVFHSNDLGSRGQRAFVVDDTSQARAGRKVQGTSCYFDHSEGRYRKGHVVLHLGLAAEKGFLPVEAQIIMGEKGAIDRPAEKPFRDGRSAAARDLARARELTKHQCLRQMLGRALQAGWSACYLLADAWFGCKENILFCLSNHLTGIFQMKRGKLTYRCQSQTYTAKQLYTKVQRRMQPANRRARYKTASLIVELNLQTDPQLPAQWAKVPLLFSAPVRTTGADQWVLFLCTEPTLTDAKILEIYALRWSIEVYFKEIKQNLGFLKEQSGRYQVAYASVHLAALRYLLLFEAMLRSGQLSYGEIRDRQSGHLQSLTYATLLWQLFRALIEGALEGLIKDLGRKAVKQILAAIDQTVEDFLTAALHMSPQEISAQLKAEELGYL